MKILKQSRYDALIELERRYQTESMAKDALIAELRSRLTRKGCGRKGTKKQREE